MIAIDTQEKFDWFLDVLDNNELQLVSREQIEKELDEISREIAKYKAMHKKEKAAKELVYA